jgi:hypothetical protein
MAKRYSPLTVVVWVGAFALLGHMGARLSQNQALRKSAGAPPAAVHRADSRQTVAPSVRDSKMFATGTPAAPTKSVSEAAHASAQTGLAAAPPLPSGPSVGACTTVRPAPSQSTQPTPPAVALNDAGAARRSGETAPGKAEMLSTPADTTRPEERHSRLAADAAAVGQSALGADDMPVEKSRGKHTRSQHARHRDGVGSGGSPMRSHDRRYAARGDLPGPPAPGFRLLPFLPTLPF